MQAYEINPDVAATLAKEVSSQMHCILLLYTTGAFGEKPIYYESGRISNPPCTVF